jgi:thiosulfate/3-mercaptopyruvate sulfurtransferase
MTDETTLPHPGPLADPEWLHRHLNAPGLRILDVRSGSDAYVQAHVPNAVHADYAAAGWRTTMEGAPGMLPPVERLCDLVSSLGIGNDTMVVLVPNGVTASDFGNAARVYWTFKVLGHDLVTILRGGFAGWTADPARPVESGPGTAPGRRPFTPNLCPGLRAAVDEVEHASETGDSILLDARSLAQHRGEEKSPAARVPGTIPGSIWLDWERLYPEGGLRVPAGIVPEDGRPVITFCNTGHSAALAWFALSEIEKRPDVALYDGSMSHWTQDPDHPVVAGDA